MVHCHSTHSILHIITRENVFNFLLCHFMLSFESCIPRVHVVDIGYERGSEGVINCACVWWRMFVCRWVGRWMDKGVLV